MLKINEVKSKFKRKSFLVTAGSYNRLLAYTKCNATDADITETTLEVIKDQLDDTKKELRTVKTRIEKMIVKYTGALLRDPDTGKLMSSKKK